MRPGTPNSYFVVHGAKDNAVPVSGARAAVQKMERLGIDFRYVEVKDGAHGGYDEWSDILTWLKRKVGWEDFDPASKPRRKKLPLP
jgi:dipeptidyl aminopeptidase/acylaminoacyl peptidase